MTLEKAKVPHWVRGVETAEVVSWPGQTPGTTQKVVLTALGGSVATPPEGSRRKSWSWITGSSSMRLPPGAVKGKILLFNHKFDKELAAQGGGLEAYGGGVVYRGAGPIAAAAAGAVAVLVRSVGGADFRLPHTGMTQYSPEVPKDSCGGRHGRGCRPAEGPDQPGPVKLHLTLTPQTLPDAASFNVIADWKGTRASGAGGGCLRPSGFVGSGHGRDRRRRGSGGFDAGDSSAAGAGDSSQADGAVYCVDERRRRLAGRGAVHGRSQRRLIANHIGAIESRTWGRIIRSGIFYAGKPASWGNGCGPWRRFWMRLARRRCEFARDRAKISPGSRKTACPALRRCRTAASTSTITTRPPIPSTRSTRKHLNENAAVMTVLAYALADSEEPAPRYEE